MGERGGCGYKRAAGVTVVTEQLCILTVFNITTYVTKFRKLNINTHKYM